MIADLTIQRTDEHIIEEQSRDEFKRILPPRWIKRDLSPDYGLDFEIIIVEDMKVTTDTLAVQLKATNTDVNTNKKIQLRIETKYLTYYSEYHIPVLLVYYIKNINSFYVLFAQSYINEVLSINNPKWRTQNTVTIKFPPDSKLLNHQQLKEIAERGDFYIIEQQLKNKAGGATTYWLDGIPKSDNQELKERTLKALNFVRECDFRMAREEYENILVDCTLSPIEKVPIIIGIGNALEVLGRLDEASKKYDKALVMVSKANEEVDNKARAAIFGNIGIILLKQGKLEESLKYAQKALEFLEAGNNILRAGQLSNIGLIYLTMEDFKKATNYFNSAKEMYIACGDKRGEIDLKGNIASLLFETGQSKKALSLYRESLAESWNIGYKNGLHLWSGGIGTVFLAINSLKRSKNYIRYSLKIARMIGYKQGEADDLANLGSVYFRMGEYDTALQYHEEALAIDSIIGYKIGEIDILINMSVAYDKKGNTTAALESLIRASTIRSEYGLAHAKKNINYLIHKFTKKSEK